jgi:hypothetical protein
MNRLAAHRLTDMRMLLTAAKSSIGEHSSYAMARKPHATVISGQVSKQRA